jgi:hypothetical protein
MVTKIQNQEFGIAISLVLLIVLLFKHIGSPFIEIVSLILVLSVLYPQIFTPFTKVWFIFGKMLGGIMSNVILFFVFFLIVTPVGLLRRMFSVDNLHLHDLKNKQHSAFVVRNKIFKASDLDNQY